MLTVAWKAEAYKPADGVGAYRIPSLSTALLISKAELYLPLLVIPVPIPVIPVVIVIVPAVPRRTPIWYAHVKRTLYTESHYRVARNSNGSTTGLAAANRANDTAHQAIVALRFDALRIGFDCISLAIGDDRLQVDDQIVVRGRPNDQLNLRIPWNRHTTIVSSNVLIYDPGIDAVIALLYIDSFVCANRDNSAPFNCSERIRIAVPVAVSVPVAVLRGGHGFRAKTMNNPPVTRKFG
jgi:hypothetical protein